MAKVRQLRRDESLQYGPYHTTSLLCHPKHKKRARFRVDDYHCTPFSGISPGVEVVFASANLSKLRGRVQSVVQSVSSSSHVTFAVLPYILLHSTPHP
eukprot:1176771-Prorocentrum_minimum.AAC.4